MKNVYIAHQSLSTYSSVLKTLEGYGLRSNIKITYSDIENEELEHLKEVVRKCDVLIADLTNPTMKMGIEMALAEVYGIYIICICLNTTAVPSYLKRMSNFFVEYSDEEQVVEDMKRQLEKRFF